MSKLRETKVPLLACIAACALAVVLTFVAACLYLRWDNTKLQTKLAEIDRIVSRRFIGELDDTELADFAAYGYFMALDDNWSSYLAEQDYEEYRLSSDGKLVGIGVSVQVSEDAVRVSGVHDASPAQQAGIEKGDYILGAEGLTVEADGGDAVCAVISGEEGTSVTLQLQKAGGEEKTLSMTRAMVTQTMVRTQMLEESIGYIQIESFHVGVAEQFSQAIDTLLDEGAKSFILDVRHNGGGRVSEMSQMLDLFLPEGNLITLRTKDGEEKTYDSDAEMLEQPIVVLVDAQSISAAEFFAAVLQEYGRATVAGVQTTGKGRAQQTFALSDGSAIVLSVEEYFTPQGKSLEETGIAPDEVVALEEEALQDFYFLTPDQDAQLKKACELLE